MKFTDHDIEDLFQNMDSKAPVEFNDTYWNEMEQLLATKPAKKKGGFWWGFVIIPILFLSVYFAFSQIDREIQRENNSFAVLQKKSDIASSVEMEQQKSTSHFASADDSVLKTSSVSKMVVEKVVRQSFKNGNLRHQGIIPVISSQNGQKMKTLNDDLLNTEIVDERKLLENSEISSLSQQEMDSEMFKKSNLKAEEAFSDEFNEETIEEKQVITSPFEETKSAISWEMYVGGMVGTQTNFGANNHSLAAGVIRFEYGVLKSWGRWTFAPSISVESTFGNVYQFDNLYVTYDFIRNEHIQSYNYNRMTNASINLQAGYYLGKSRHNHLEVMVAPVFNLYNNIVYKEMKNGELSARNEYFNQNLGLNRTYLMAGIRYSYWVTPHLSLGIEVNSNFGTLRKQSFKAYSPSVSNYQLGINVRYFLK